MAASVRTIATSRSVAPRRPSDGGASSVIRIAPATIGYAVRR
jgi:hypothetical protein